MARLLLLILVVLAVPVSADAATVATIRGTIDVQGATGERNDVHLVFEDSGDITVSDIGAPLDAGRRCTAIDEHTARCSAPTNNPRVNVTLGDGDDVLTMEGADARDVLADGGPGNDTMNGGTGDQTLYGGPGADSLAGGEGYDALTGGPGSDAVSGEAGDDILFGGRGDDVVQGGPGADVLDFAGGGADTAACDDGRDVVRNATIEVTLGPDCERLIFDDARVRLRPAPVSVTATTVTFDRACTCKGTLVLREAVDAHRELGRGRFVDGRVRVALNALGRELVGEGVLAEVTVPRHDVGWKTQLQAAGR